MNHQNIILSLPNEHSGQISHHQIYLMAVILINLNSEQNCNLDLLIVRKYSRYHSLIK